MIAVIERDENYLMPNGSTILEVNDKLVVFTDKLENIIEVHLSLKLQYE